LLGWRRECHHCRVAGNTVWSHVSSRSGAATYLQTCCISLQRVKQEKMSNVHPYLFPQSPILSTSPSLPASFIPLSRNPLISPLLKKPTLDKVELSSYRPNSNLSLISKIIERVVKSRLTDHLTSNSLLNPHQSAYCKYHSTETALLYIHDHLVSAIGSQKIWCLCLLDLSAAFDTIDHDILITRLSPWFGIHGSVLSWFKSYLSSRTFRVKCVTDLAVSPKALSLVHCSSSSTPLLSAPSVSLVL